MKRGTLIRLLALLILLLVPSKEASAWGTCQEFYDFVDGGGLGYCTYSSIGCSCTDYGTPEQECTGRMTDVHCEAM
jgi:hypothetical protein